MATQRARQRSRKRLSGRPAEDGAAEIVNGLRRIVRAIELYSQEVRKGYSLTGPQLWALKTLYHQGSLTIGQLATALAVKPSSLSLLLVRLERRRLVRRVRRQDDRRFVAIELTKSGAKLAARAPEAAQGKLLHGLRGLKPREVSSLARAVRRLVAMMEASDVKARFFFADE